jgi:hypothetical protein
MYTLPKAGPSMVIHITALLTVGVYLAIKTLYGLVKAKVAR